MIKIYCLDCMGNVEGKVTPDGVICEFCGKILISGNYHNDRELF